MRLNVFSNLSCCFVVYILPFGNECNVKWLGPYWYVVWSYDLIERTQQLVEKRKSNRWYFSYFYLCFIVYKYLVCKTVTESCCDCSPSILLIGRHIRRAVKFVYLLTYLLTSLPIRDCTRKHKCKKKHFGPAPCDDCLSEYRNTYVRKPIGPPKSCKPDQTPMMSDAPAEDKTTTRYILLSIIHTHHFVSIRYDTIVGI